MNLENKKQLATILLAVGLGLVAAFLTAKYVESDVKRQTKALAKDYQKKNTVLIKEIENMKRSQKKLEAGHAALIKENQRLAALAARPVQVAPTIDKKPKSDKTQFSVRTPPGKRALTINIDSLSAVGGLISAGDFVDVLGHLNVPDEGKITSILFQNIKVLAVGTAFTPGANDDQYTSQQKARSLQVTIALTPEEVGLLTFAQQHGKLQLALRRPAEKGTQLLQVASWDGLSDYVLDRQGTEFAVPMKDTKIAPVEIQPQKREVTPFVEIFRGR